jgi:hypothetical protein
MPPANAPTLSGRAHQSTQGDSRVSPEPEPIPSNEQSGWLDIQSRKRGRGPALQESSGQAQSDCDSAGADCPRADAVYATVANSKQITILQLPAKDEPY